MEGGVIMADEGHCPSHGRMTQQLDRIENKLDSFTDRLTEGAIRFENHDGRIKACEARNATEGSKANDWRKVGLGIIQTLTTAGVGIAIGMKL